MNLLFCSDVAERAHALSHHHQPKLKLDKKKVMSQQHHALHPLCIDDWLGPNVT